MNTKIQKIQSKQIGIVWLQCIKSYQLPAAFFGWNFFAVSALSEMAKTFGRFRREKKRTAINIWQKIYRKCWYCIENAVVILHFLGTHSRGKLLIKDWTYRFSSYLILDKLIELCFAQLFKILKGNENERKLFQVTIYSLGNWIWNQSFCYIDMHSKRLTECGRTNLDYKLWEIRHMHSIKS